MSRIVKLVAALLVVSGAGWAVYDFTYWPYRCSVVEKQMEARTTSASHADHYSGVVIARENLRMVVPMLDRCARPGLYMIVAINRRVLNEPELAIQYYRRSLQYDLRPEIFFELGLTELEAGRRADAFDSLTAASLFYIGYLHEIPYPEVREEVGKAMHNPATMTRLEKQWAKRVP